MKTKIAKTHKHRKQNEEKFFIVNNDIALLLFFTWDNFRIIL